MSLPHSVTETELDALIFPPPRAELAQGGADCLQGICIAQARLIAVNSDVIAARMRELVETGTTEGVDNLTMWRRSEVRLKARSTRPPRPIEKNLSGPLARDKQLKRAALT